MHDGIWVLILHELICSMARTKRTRRTHTEGKPRAVTTARVTRSGATKQGSKSDAYTSKARSTGKRGKGKRGGKENIPVKVTKGQTKENESEVSNLAEKVEVGRDEGEEMSIADSLKELDRAVAREILNEIVETVAAGVESNSRENEGWTGEDIPSTPSLGSPDLQEHNLFLEEINSNMSTPMLLETKDEIDRRFQQLAEGIRGDLLIDNMAGVS